MTVTVVDPLNTEVTADPESLPFTPSDWNEPQTVTVAAAHDADETDETETITHTVSSDRDSYYHMLTVDSVTVAVDDVPDVAVSFKSAAYTVAEDDTVDVKVTLDAAPERELTIELTATGEGGAVADEYSVPAEVVFGKEDTMKAITFRATSDTVDDDGESVKLGFKTPLPYGVSAGTYTETVVSITDDDVPSSLTVEFGSATYSVTEGEEGVEVTVTLSEDPEQTVIIPITRVNQDGASDSDYTGVPENVTFNRGEMVRSFIVEAVRDNLEDGGESVKLGFGTLPITVTEGTTDEATVTIANVAAQTSLTINFGAAMYSLTEGEEATVTVTLNTAPGSDATIPLIKTDRGGATDDDYTVVKKVTFESDDTTKTMTFIAKDDDVDDDGESVKLEFGDLPGGVSAGTVKETVVSIVDDDEPGVEVSFDQATYSATEGGANAEIMVRLSAPAPHPVDIPLTAEGHYKATPDDWTGVPEVLTFNTGDTWKSFTLVAFDDTVKDDGEMVELGFGALPDGFVAGSPATARVTLMNDDRVQTEPDGEPDFAGHCGDTRASLTIGEPFSGRLGAPYDIDAVMVEFTAGSLGYRVSLRDDDNEQISAEDFYIGMVHPDPIDPGERGGKIYRMYVSYPYLTNRVTEGDNLVIIPEQTGTYCVEIQARSARFTGGYNILVEPGVDPLDGAVTGAESNSPGGDAVEGMPSGTERFHRISVGTNNAIVGAIQEPQDKD